MELPSTVILLKGREDCPWGICQCGSHPPHPPAGGGIRGSLGAVPSQGPDAPPHQPRPAGPPEAEGGPARRGPAGLYAHVPPVGPKAVPPTPPVQRPNRAMGWFPPRKKKDPFHLFRALVFVLLIQEFSTLLYRLRCFFLLFSLRIYLFFVLVQIDCHPPPGSKQQLLDF